MLTMIRNKQASFVNTVFRGIIRSYKFCSEQWLLTVKWFAL